MLIEQFLAQYPQSTRKTYLHTLSETQKVTGKSIETSSQDDILKYQQYIADQSPATVARKLATVDSFFDYLIKRGIASENPCESIRRPKVDRIRSIKYLDTIESRTLVNSTEDIQAKTILFVLLHGLRLSELVALNVEQLSGNMLTNVIGKGDKSRNVPLEDSAIMLLRQYIGNRRTGPMFLSNRGTRISGRSVQRLVNTISDTILGKRVNVHALRHSFGTRKIKENVNLITLQRLMGHESPNTTQVYVHLDDTDLQEAVVGRPLMQDVVQSVERPQLVAIAGRRS